MLPTIEAMHKDGHAVTVIARKLGVPAKALYPVMRRMGLVVTRNARRSGLTGQQILELVVAYAQGASTSALAAEYGIEAGTVASYLRAAGVEVRPPGFRQGEEHHAWIGGRHVTPDGYVRLWIRDDDPLFCMAQEHSAHGGYILEHRYVMAKKLGRPLAENETVHHKDTNRQNNEPNNLQLRIGKHGKGGAFRCLDCGSHNIEALPLGAPH
jgi:hypothetical protein